MKYQELDELITKLYPLQPYDLVLNKSCIARMNFRFDEGSKNRDVFIIYYRVLVSVKNMDHFYLEIEEHPAILSCEKAISILNDSDIYISEADLQELRDSDVKRNLNRPNHMRDEILKRIIEYSGKSESEILKLAGLPS
jgi:hypothetical protein